MNDSFERPGTSKVSLRFNASHSLTITNSRSAANWHDSEKSRSYGILTVPTPHIGSMRITSEVYQSKGVTSLGKLNTRNGQVRAAAVAATPPMSELRKLRRFILQMPLKAAWFATQDAIFILSVKLRRRALQAFNGQPHCWEQVLFRERIHLSRQRAKAIVVNGKTSRDYPTLGITFKWAIHSEAILA